MLLLAKSTLLPPRAILPLNRVVAPQKTTTRVNQGGGGGFSSRSPRAHTQLSWEDKTLADCSSCQCFQPGRQLLLVLCDALVIANFAHRVEHLTFKTIFITCIVFARLMDSPIRRWTSLHDKAPPSSPIRWPLQWVCFVNVHQWVMQIIYRQWEATNCKLQ